jgi:hypothetical protein
MGQNDLVFNLNKQVITIFIKRFPISIILN